ncbi:sulfotransferase family cytosolic 2B member 1-like [Alligator sinensis]|uniref:Sulfotransferase n=1 Tax=Alligator sinensis TaxID=38654 RepID=A0A1U8DNF2_ALLSI|nr:sulfotransferase family cytosolic 2B member 1-like [Alligator sinensis]XP_025050873.1 sulfotransferase family cytosolic 2B member 1-like [Alligator sinensis]
MATEYITYKGMLFPLLDYSPETISYLQSEFQVWDDDVFNVTYPKSGTNWMLEILSLIRCDGDPSWTRSVLNWDRAPWIESNNGLEVALKYPPPRLLSSHMPLQFFPRSFQGSRAKVIYTLRSPKDVVTSYYHFTHIMHAFKDHGPLDAFLQDFLSGNVPYGSWFDHVAGWLGLRGQDNFFYITYEELQQDLRGSIQRISHFLGKELSEQQISSVVENASFQTMRRNKMCNFSEVPDKYMDHSKGQLLRKGVSGDWKNLLSEEQSRRIDTVYQEWMQGLGITFPWD